MESSDYRRYAVECFRLSATMKDPESKASLIAMGQAWLSLAELSDGNRQSLVRGASNGIMHKSSTKQNTLPTNVDLLNEWLLSELETEDQTDE